MPKTGRLLCLAAREMIVFSQKTFYNNCMDNHDKNFKFFLGGVLGLALIVSVIFLWRSQHTTYRTDNTPEAVVFNYLLALQRHDSAKLAELIVADDQHPDRLAIESALAEDLFSDDYSVRILGSSIQDERAIVTLEFWESQGPFSSGYTYQDSAELVKKNGVWQIDRMPDRVWAWRWMILPTPKEEQTP